MPTKRRWEESQKLEKEYHESDKPKQWKVPYSFKYWSEHIELQDIEGINIEVGSGPDGFWRFSDKIIGTDSIDFSHLGKNFVRTEVENLPFSNNYFRDCYAINMLDHTYDPQKALNEMIRVASHRIYIISNTFSPFLQFIMRKFDPVHPYHFTEQDLLNLIPDTVQISLSKRKTYSEIETAISFYKLKLQIAQFLGSHRLLLHLDKKV